MTFNQAWATPVKEIAEQLEVDPREGLHEAEVKRRRERYGENRLRSTETKSPWRILVDQFKSLLVGLLAMAGVLSLIFSEVIEGIAILVVILINAAIGFFTELRAVRAMEALQEMGSVPARVLREGTTQEVPAEAIVPGDLVVLESGDVVTADLRLVEASKLQADESALTGESVPATKQVEPTAEDTPLAERASMVYKGTAITRGAGKGIAVATGMKTELGEISELVEEAEEEITPLEKRLDQLGQRLVWVTLIIALVVGAAGIAAGKDLLRMIETAIALAVATVPEGLPIVATIALARGMQRMARRNALVNKLSAVETLGATNVICTDKTGTLTENRMTVVELALPTGDVRVSGKGLELEGSFSRDGETVEAAEGSPLRELLETGALCNNAALQPETERAEDQAVGEPLEVALLVAAAKAGIHQDDLVEKTPEVREIAFDPDVKMMATFHQTNGSYRVAVKGAPEPVLKQASRILTSEGERELGEEERDEWLARNSDMAAEGLRVLALAQKTTDSEDSNPYQNLTFLGLAGLLDPPREEVAQSIQACQKAGIQVVMVTGDQPVTAKKVGTAVGLIEGVESADVVHGQDFDSAEELLRNRERILQAPIFARVSPKQKLDLIAAYQEAGSIVAMTGDGVNDAPALKKADIGIAMGQRGTQVAKEAAAMVLQDDAFSTIVAAVWQGRVIFDNIRKFVLYLLSCNVSEIAVIGLASVVNAPLPITPLQILYLNLVTDVFPALALGVGDGDYAIMDRPPRDPKEPVLTRGHWGAIVGYSGLITVAVLGAFALAFAWLGKSQAGAVSISFLTLAFAQLWHVFNMRTGESNFIRNEITQNPYVWGALALTTGLLLGAVYVPFLAEVLSVVNPESDGWALVIGASLFPWLIGQIMKGLR